MSCMPDNRFQPTAHSLRSRASAEPQRWRKQGFTDILGISTKSEAEKWQKRFPKFKLKFRSLSPFRSVSF
jgi:hypothetical protein